MPEPTDVSAAPPLASLPLFQDGDSASTPATAGPASPGSVIARPAALAGPGLSPATSLAGPFDQLDRRAAAPPEPEAVEPPATGPASQPGRSGRPQALDPAHRATDWGLVRALRQQAADKLSVQLQNRSGLDEAARHELGRRIVMDLLTSYADEAQLDGVKTFTVEEIHDLATAVVDALFGLGRLQGLVDRTDLENIEAYGHDEVWLEHSDGSLTPGPPIADSDEEMLEQLQFLASRNGDRPFSPLHPHLNMRLPGGARLAAAGWGVAQPYVTIRLHRLVDVSVEDLTERGMWSSDLASFLVAAVRHGYSLVVSGPMGAGKTTTLRALCGALDFEESIGTFETEFELHLHELKHRHQRVKAFEARPGAGEAGPDGHRIGELTLDEHLLNAWRHNLSRLVVGELRGKEIKALFKAMQGAAGSMSSLHARNAHGAIGRMVTLATDETSASDGYATRVVSESIQLIVQLSLDTSVVDGVRRRQRYVTEVLALEPRGDGTPTVTQVFQPGPDGRAMFRGVPNWMAELAWNGSAQPGRVA